MIFKVTFLDYWHLSSGLNAGARFDSMAIKDSDLLPYIPGKSIKGLLREFADDDFLDVCFGKEIDKSDEKTPNQQGICYFSDVCLCDEDRESIICEKLQENLYDVIAFTKIDEMGVAADHSLREIEVVIPVSLYGEILNIPTQYKEKMKICLKKIKRMGLSRNRGLGRCSIEILGDDE